jgi:hypothetical protein
LHAIWISGVGIFAVYGLDLGVCGAACGGGGDSSAADSGFLFYCDSSFLDAAADGSLVELPSKRPCPRLRRGQGTPLRWGFGAPGPQNRAGALRGFAAVMRSVRASGSRKNGYLESWDRPHPLQRAQRMGTREAQQQKALSSRAARTGHPQNQETSGKSPRSQVAQTTGRP